MSGRASVALVTCAAHPDLSPDDRLLLPALAAVGLDPVARQWDSTDEAWESHAAVVVRSCWDYHLRPREFHRWLDALERVGARVFNPVPVLRWNAEKTYLRDLEVTGLEVVPTAWVGENHGGSLAELVEERGWLQAVVKPSVSATAYETWRVGPVITPEDERRFRRLAQRGTVMVQPYLESIEQGELSLVFIAGRFSHAVLKRARAGDFRVQTDFGGTVEPVRPAAPVVEGAARVLVAAPGPALYARVDGCLVDGQLRLMELELLEPALYFAHDDAAPQRFARALRAALY